MWGSEGGCNEYFILETSYLDIFLWYTSKQTESNSFHLFRNFFLVLLFLLGEPIISFFEIYENLKKFKFQQMRKNEL